MERFWVHLIDIKDVIENAGTLLTLPDICLQLKRIVDDPDSSVADLAELIAKDPALTARLLKIVNSPLYYFPRKISSVSQAISLIGTEQLYNLALATSAAAIIRAAGGGYIELKTLWKYSVYSALLTQNISSEKPQSRESLFIAGLLSNIGVLAVVKYAPDVAMNAIENQAKNQFPWQREKDVLGLTMAEASGALLCAWNLPDEIVVPVRLQNQPDKLQPYYHSCCVLHIATRLASEMVIDELEYSLDYRAAIVADSLQELEMSAEDLDEVVARTHEIAPGMFNIFIL